MGNLDNSKTGRLYTARIWNVATEEQVGPSMKHGNAVTNAVFSPGRKQPFQILTAGFDTRSHLWSIDTKKIGLGKKHDGPVNRAAFRPDGKRILTASQNVVRIWEIGGDPDIPADPFQLQAGAVTGVKYDVKTGETKCIASPEWYRLKKKYNRQAKDHFKKCQYPQYNWWQRFHLQEAEER